MRYQIYTVICLGIAMIGLSSQVDAQRRNERQIRDQIRNLSSQIDNFQYSIENELRSTSAGRQMDEASDAVRNLQEKVNAFEDNFNQRRENRDDVNAIVDAARDIDAFLRREPQNQRISSDWNAVRVQIERLASNYGVAVSWTSLDSNYPTARGSYPQRSTSPRSPLTGTYRLDPSRSENTDQIISETNVGGVQRQDLQQKLEAPQEIAIDIRGRQVTLASSIASPVTFNADGREKTETDASGRTVRVRATLRGQDLTISSLGGDTDYTVTFVPLDGGRSLKVTRRITTDYLRQTVFADSIYEKTDDLARLGIDSGDQTPGGWSSNDPGPPYGNNPNIAQGRTGEFIVPNGAVVNGLLESTIDTKVSQNNDRFRLTVQTPDEFRGAVIEGYITGVGRSGRVSGRSNVTFNFESITMRDGKRYDFSGSLLSVKDQNGKTIRVDNEGTAKSDSQTKETAKRGGIGAGLGAIIGAIAGGGKGAVLGAIIGGGAGAGSVIATGREDIQLFKGTMLTIQASSPIRDNPPRQDN
jgi:hypothetical protein